MKHEHALNAFTFAVVVCIVVVTAVRFIPRAEVQTACPGLTHMRDEFIKLNDLSAAVLGPQSEQVDVGSAPNCACGDPVDKALSKVYRNMERMNGLRLGTVSLPINGHRSGPGSAPHSP